MTSFLLEPSSLGGIAARSFVLLLLTAGIAFACRRRSASVVHGIWTAGLGGCLVIPLVMLLSPNWSLPLLPSETSADFTTAASVGTSQTATNAGTAAHDLIDHGQTTQRVQPTTQPTTEPVPITPTTPDSVGQEGRQSMSTVTSHLQWPSLATVAMVIWMAGLCVMLVRLLQQTIAVRRRVKQASDLVDADWDGQRDVVAGLLGLQGTVALKRHPEALSPMVIGLFEPVVLLPGDSDTWSEQRRMQVLLHELAHVGRHDVLTQTMAALACAVYWFNPLAWWGASRMKALREIACDDAVVTHSTVPANYAQTLLDVAKGYRHQPLTSAVAMARSSNVESRIQAILSATRSRAALTTRSVRFLAAAALFVAAFVGTCHLSSRATEQEADSGFATPEEPVEEVSLGNHSPVASRKVSTEPLSYSGRVVTPQGEPIAGAKIWLAVASHQYTLVADRDNREGLLRELGTTDKQGRFEVVLDTLTIQEIRKRQEIHKRFNYYQTQLVATAEGRGLDWMPLDVFEDNPASSAERDTMQARIDQSLGDGYFASRTLKLRPESRPVRGRLVDLEGHRLPNVTVLVESLRQVDIPRLLKAFEMSWKREMNEAFSATSFGVGGLARSELQKLIPPVTTDENGEFELRGIGDDQLVTLVFAADRVEARPLHVLGRELETVSLPHIEYYPGGAKEEFVGRDFTYALGPSVPVEGVVTDYDTGEPVAGVLVYVDRLFKEGSVNQEQLRLDTRHMRAVTDGQGRFRITGMPPGEGHVLQVVPRKSEPYLETSQDVSLRLEDGDTKRVDFQVKRGIWIEGRVTDKQSGEPLTATVGYLALKKNPHALENSGLDWDWITERYGTDSDGHYRTLGLPGPGVLLVTMQVPGYPKAAGAETIDGYDASGGVIPTVWPQQVSNWHLLKQIEPAADAISFNCDLMLEADVSIPGRVVGSSGNPISDLYVLGQTEGDVWWRPRHTDYVRKTNRFAVYGYDGKGPRQLFFKNKDETLVGEYRLEGDAPEEIVVTLQPSVRVTGRLIANETDLPAARYFLNCERCFLFNEEYPPVKFRTHWCFTDDEGRFEIKGLMAGLTYEMNAWNDSNPDNEERFTIDLTDAKPGEVIELGNVTGPNSVGPENSPDALD